MDEFDTFLTEIDRTREIAKRYRAISQELKARWYEARQAFVEGDTTLTEQEIHALHLSAMHHAVHAAEIERELRGLAPLE